MRLEPWSPKQREMIDAIILDNDCRMVVASGSKGAGKSLPSTSAAALWAQRWHDADMAICAASDSRLKHMMRELEQIAGMLGVPYRRRDAYIEFGDNQVLYWVSKHKQSYETIKGHNLSAIIADEGSELHENCVREMKQRARVPPVKIVITTNPDGPLHPFYVDTILRIEANEINGKVFYFALDDNPGLDDDTKHEMKQACLPVGSTQWQRDVEGMWVSAGGAIFGDFSHAVRKPPKPETELPMRMLLCVDPATVGIAGAVLLGGYTSGRWWVFAEWRRDNRSAESWVDRNAQRRNGIMPRDEMAHAIVRWANSTTPVGVADVVCDEADTAFKEMLKDECAEQMPKARVVDAPKPKLAPSLRRMASALHNGRLFISPQCGHLVAEMQSAQYDADKLKLTGEEVPAEDTEDHLQDATRYGCEWAGVNRLD